jgi:hypothetical protein
MYTGRMIFAQLADFLSPYEFDKCVRLYGGNYKVKSFRCWDQFLCMAFAQLTYRESLRDIEACLRASGRRLYHMGIRGKVSRNTLAHANEIRDWRIYEAFAQILIQRARRLYVHDDAELPLDQVAYVLDSTTVDLCLSLFPWAQSRKHKSAIKLHTLLDLRGCIPTLVIITSSKVYDAKILDQIPLQQGAFYIMDRGYLDFRRLHMMHQNGSFFVTRAISRLACRRMYSRPVDKTTGLQCDQTIVFSGPLSKTKYPDMVRRIRYVDPETNNNYVFLTNNFVLPALCVAELYHHRWRVELFFKWIKQHLRIKSFYGTSPNAVKTQIWIAISVYVLIAIVKKQLNLPLSLYTILQILSISLFEKTPILEVLQHEQCNIYSNQDSKQLYLQGLTLGQ